MPGMQSAEASPRHIGTGQDSEQVELFCRVCDPVDEDIEDGVEEEAEVQWPLRDPGMPTRREVLEQNLAHELGRDETTEGDGIVDNPDKVEDESQTVSVMQESECRSVWNYAVER